MTIEEMAAISARKLLQMKDKRHLKEKRKYERKQLKVAEKIKVHSIIGTDKPENLLHSFVQDIVDDLFASGDVLYEPVRISVIGRTMTDLLIEIIYSQINVRFTQVQAISYAVYNFLPDPNVFISDDIVKAFSYLTKKVKNSLTIKLPPALMEHLEAYSIDTTKPRETLIEIALHTACYVLTDGELLQSPYESYETDLSDYLKGLDDSWDFQPLTENDVVYAKIYGEWESGMFNGYRKLVDAIDKWRKRQGI